MHGGGGVPARQPADKRKAYDSAVASQVHMRLVLAASSAIALLACASAWAEIYKWTNEDGGTTYSNVLPSKPTRVKNVEVVIEDEKPDKAAASVAASRREQELLERINRLERQVQAQQYQGPLPPPPPDYSTSYPSSYYASPYYPAFYAFPYGVVRTRFAAPVRRFVSPGFTRVSSFHRAGIHRGRR